MLTTALNNFKTPLTRSNELSRPRLTKSALWIFTGPSCGRYTDGIAQAYRHLAGQWDYLVLNYDTVLENALAIERVPFADGLDGGATGWWNPCTYERGGLAARVFKLHGSVDWCQIDGDLLPRRLAPDFEIDRVHERRVLIWPASTKYAETQRDPYAQLMAHARKVLRAQPGDQRVLVICGYSFGDSHINTEIYRGLRESAGDLTVVAFTGSNRPSGQLCDWLKDEEVSGRVIIFGKRGFFHGKQSVVSENDLPWWKFERYRSVVGG